MKNNFLIPLAVLLFCPISQLAAQDPTSDSLDVLHYNLTLDMGNQVEKQLYATAEITFVLTRDCDGADFDIICDSLHPVSLDGVMTRGFSYDPDWRRLHVNINGGQAGDTHIVSVPYYSNGHVESHNWGGLHMDNGIYYTLGVAFEDYPHVYGRSWFPCRDNFYDKATYRITITAKPGWRAICSGLRQEEVFNNDSSSTSVWIIDHPTPTYLVSVSTANWHVIERQFHGIYGSYPSIIGYSSHDSLSVQQSFDILDDVVPAYERAFGPYRWDRIGYIATPKGSMEHVSNIGFVSSCMGDTSQDCQMVACHELAHAWFGNLVTCASQEDMWINEGGASFCEEVAMEAAFGPEAATDYYRDRLSDVLRNTHLQDRGYRALSGMDKHYTYGSTTYYKGALVWHSLRGIMGDSLFYACMQQLFDRCAFGNLDAASLRDSLSLYSGMDLSDFFDFHVFQPGFVDYCIDSLATDGSHATLTIHQLLRGTESYAHGIVPVTFYSADHRASQQWMQVDDSIATAVFDLPFEAAYAVVDPDNRLSDACTDDTLLITSAKTYDLPHSFTKVSCPQNTDGIWLHVGHHYAHPGGTLPQGVVRINEGYWQVTGIIPWEVELQGRFLYNMGANNAVGAGNLLTGFYDRRQTLDSICLLYRPSSGQPWQCVSHRRTNNSNTTNGYFTARLFPGQYALAIADTALLAIHEPVATTPSITLSPNPNQGEFRINMGGYDKKFQLTIVDSAGRKALKMRNLHDGDTIHHHLRAGTYIVIIENNFISLQSQIIVQ